LDVLQLLLVVALAAAVVAVVLAPLRARPDAGDVADERAGRREALEAAREAKYREIREAELDVRTGKLAREDWEAIDRRLRAEAMDVLRALDGLEAGPQPGRSR
jgi:hypothetical protein